MVELEVRLFRNNDGVDWNEGEDRDGQTLDWRVERVFKATV